MRKVALGAAVGVAALCWVLRPTDPALGSVRFFDVGQGDAALVQSGRTQVLIDGGPDQRVLSQLGRVMPALDRQIEVVIVSHPHADHYRGLVAVVERYDVGTVYVSGVTSDSPEYQHFLALSRRRGAVVTVPSGNQSLAIPNGSVRFAYPPDGFAGRQVSNLNDASLVVQVTLGPARILFPGDAEAAEERAMLAGGDWSADVLKVAHHGSRTSSLPEFLAAVTPRAAVISAGARNRYHHPAPQTLNRLRDAGIRTYRTDQNGTVTVTATTSGWRIQSEP